MRKNVTVPLSEFREDEPRYGRWITILGHGCPTFVSKEQVCKVIERYGNDINGWRYIVEYKFIDGNERFSPPTFHIEPATEEEWNNQKIEKYFPHKIERWKKEYEQLPKLPKDSVSFTSGEIYEVTPEDPADPNGCLTIFPNKTDLLGLQDFYRKEMGDEACCWDRFLYDFYKRKGWKIKRFKLKYYP